MPRILSALMAVAALAFAGCGSDDNSTSSAAPPAAVASTPTTPPKSATPSNTASTPASSDDSGATGEVEIKMQNIQFSPNNVTVKVGQKVKWVNEDSVDHNVTATDGENFKSDNFGKGKSYEYTVDKPGTIKYTCTIHPGMDGTLTVTK